MGQGISGYEWAYTINKEHVPVLIKALGGNEGDSILALLAEKCSGDHESVFSELLTTHNIPRDFGSWRD